jgi:hypothetical protein
MRTLTVAAAAVCAAVGIAAAISPRASGEPEAAPGPTVTVLDRTGDVLDGNYKHYPTRLNVDIRRAQVTRVASGLRVVVDTLAPHRGGQAFAFVYGNQEGSRGGRVQVIPSVSANSPGFADANVKPSQDVSQLPPSSFRFSGNRLVLVVPNAYLDPLPTFRWQVSTFQALGDTAIIGDHAPDQKQGLPDTWKNTVKSMARYP